MSHTNFPSFLPHFENPMRRRAVWAAVALGALPVFAGPSGEQVISGNASFNRDGALTQITASDGAIIQYTSFDIPELSTVQFIQPGAQATVLNRITESAHPTQILGTLTANGQVYLVNPAGITFGHNATLDVGALFAVAGNMTDADFINGLNRFSGLEGSVDNFGSISAQGTVGLFGSRVGNYGSIVSTNDMIALASGGEIFLGERDGNFFVRIDAPASVSAAGGPAVENAGSLTAEKGGVLLASGDMLGLAIMHSGIIRTRDADISATGSGTAILAGDVVFTADHSTLTVDAHSVDVTGTVTSPGYTGGDVAVYADHLSVDARFILPGGRVLLDPADVTIDNVGGGDNITVATILTSLDAGTDFIVEASNSLTVAEAIDSTGNNDAGAILTLRDEIPGGTVTIDINAPITLHAGEQLTITGNQVNVNAGLNVGILNVTSNLSSLGADVVTTGAQTFTGAIELLADVLLEGNTLVTDAIDAGGNTLTLDGATSVGTGAITNGNLITASAATIDSAAVTNATVNGALTVTNALGVAGNLVTTATVGAASVSVTGTSTLGADVTTSGAQSYTLAMDLTGDVVLQGDTITAAAIDGGGNTLTLDGATSVGTGAITNGNLIAASAATIDSAAVTNATVNDALTVTNAFGVAGNLVTTATVGAASVSVTGTSTLGANVTTSGAQQYTGSVDLTDDIILGGSALTFSNTVDGTQSLTLNSVGGTVSLSGDVGGTTALTALALTASTATLNAPVTAGLATGTAATVNTAAPANLTGVASELETQGVAFTGVSNLNSTNGNLIGSATNETYNLTGSQAGSVSSIAFTGITAIDAGAASTDTVTTNAITTLTPVANQAVSHGITVSNFQNLSSSNGNLVGSAGNDSFTIPAANSGSVAGIAFSGINSINGAGGSNSLINTVVGEPGRFFAATNTVAGVVVQNIANIDTSLLSLTTGADTFTVTAMNAGTFNALSFTGLTQVNALGGNDTLINLSAFTYTPGSGQSGNVAGIATSGFQTVNTPNLNLSLTTGDDTFEITGVEAGRHVDTNVSYTGIVRVDGLTGTNTLINLSGLVFAYELDVMDPGLIGEVAGVEIVNFQNVQTPLLSLNVPAGNPFTVTGVGQGQIDAVSFTNLSSVTSLGVDGFLVNSLAAETFAAANMSVAGIVTTGFVDVQTARLSLTTGNDAFTVTASGEGAFASVDYTGLTDVDGLAGNDTITTNASAALTGVANTFATAGIDFVDIEGLVSTEGTLAGSAANETFSLTASESGTVSGIAFSGIQTIDTGAVSTDTVITSAVATLTGVSNQVLSHDITVSNLQNLQSTNGNLIGSATNETYNLTGSEAGSVSSIAFSGISAIDAGAASTDTVTTNAIVTLTGASNEATSHGVTVSNFQNLVSTQGTLAGSAADETFNQNGDASGTVSGIAYSGVSTINAGAGNDILNLTADQTLAFTFDGQGGNDTANVPVAFNAPSLTLTGEAINLGGNMTTSGGQTYTGVTNLTTNVALQGATIVAGTINAGGNLLTLNGSSSVNTGAITNGNLLTVTAATIASTAVTDATVNAVLNVTNAFNVGGNLLTTATVAAASVAVTGTSSLGGNVTTSGAQSYTGGMALTSDVTLQGDTLTAGTINAGGNTLTLDGATNATTGAISNGNLIAANAATIANASVTNATVNGSLTVTNAFDVAGNLLTTAPVGAASVAVTGTSSLGGNVTTSGAQSYTGAMALASDVTLQGDTLTAGIINAGGNTLTLDGATSVATGTISNGNLITASAATIASTAVTNATVNGALTVTNAFNVGGNLLTTATVDAGSVAVTATSSLGGNVTTSGAQNYTGGMALTSDVTLQGDTLTAGTINAGGNTLTLDGATSVATGAISNGNLVAASAATVANASVTDATVNGALTVTNAFDVAGNLLTTSTVDAASVAITGTSSLGGDVTTVGAQSYTGAVALTTDVVLQGDALTTGIINAGGNTLTLDGATSVTTGTISNGNLVAASAATVASASVTDATVNGALTVTTTLAVAGDLLTTATVDAASVAVTGTSSLGADVTTTGAQSYTGAMALTSDVVLQGDTLTTGVINAGGNLLTLNGTTAVTTGAISNGNLLTASAATIGSASVTDATVNGALNVINTLAVAGDLLTTATVDAASVAITGTSSLGGDVTTTGAQSYTGAMALTSDVVLQGDTLTAGVINAGGNLLTLNGTTGVTTGAISNGNLFTASAASIAAAAVTDATVNGALIVTNAFDVGGNLLTTATVDAGSVSVTGTSSLGADVTTTGAQNYSGAMALTSDVTLQGDTLTAGTVDAGGNTLTLDGATSVATGAIANGNLVTASAATIASTVVTDATVNGALTVTNAFDVAGNLLTTATVDAGSISVTGTSSLGADVTTTGAQSYTGAMALTANVVLEGDTLTAGIINGGGNTLTLDGATSVTTGAISNGSLVAASAATVDSASVTDATINGALTVTTTLGVAGDLLTTATVDAASIAVTGTSSLGADVTTTGAQSYTGAMALTSDVVLQGDTLTAGVINAGGNLLTLNGATGVTTGAISNGNLLTASAATIGSASVTDATVNGSLTVINTFDVAGNLLTTATVDAASVAITGTSSLGGDVTTSGAQSYNGAIALTSDVVLQGDTLTAGVINAGGNLLTLNGATGVTTGAISNGNLLTASAATIDSATVADATVNGALTVTDFFIVGGDLVTTAAVDAASVDVTGTSSLGDDVTTSGTQDYAGATTLTSNVALFGTEITAATIDGGGNTLTLNGSTSVETGAITNGNLITASAATLASASVTDATINGALAVNDFLNVGGNLLTTAAVDAASVDVAGTSSLGGDVTTSGTQDYAGVTTLTSNVVLQGTEINTAAINAGGNLLTLNGSTSVDAGAVTNGDLLTLSAANLASASVNGATINGTLTVSDFFNVGGNLLTTATVNAASVDVSGTSSLGGDLLTTGTQDYTGAISLTSDVSLQGSAITTAQIDAGGNLLTLDGSTSVATGAITNGDLLTLSAATLASAQVTDATINGALTVSSFFDVAGDLVTTASIDAASIEVAGLSSLGGNVTTSGIQDYTGDITLTGNVVLQGSTITAPTVNAGGNTLTLNGSASVDTGAITNGNLVTESAATIASASLSDAIVNGPLTVVSGLNLSGNLLSTAPVTAQFVTVGGSASLGADVTTSGNQTYTGAVTLTETLNLDGSALVFQSAVNALVAGVQGLTIAGNALFADTVGATALSALAVSGTSSLGGNVTTTGSQTYSGAVTLTETIGLSGSTVDMQNTVNALAAGVQGLTITGNALFADTVGSTALAALSVSGTSSLGADVTTTGSQTYSGAVTLAENVSLNTAANNGNLLFQSTVNGNRNLTLMAGTGAITFSEAVGGTTPLGDFLVQSAQNVTANSLTAASFTQAAGSGLTSLDGAVGLTNGFNFTGNELTVNAAVNAGGDVVVSNAGNFTTAVNGSLTSAAFTQNGAGGNVIEGALVTTGGDLTFATPVTVPAGASATVDTGAGAGAVTLNQPLIGTGNLAISAGTGDVSFVGDVGVSTANRFGNLSIINAGQVAFPNAVFANSVSVMADNNLTLTNVDTSGDQTYRYGLSAAGDGFRLILNDSIFVAGGVISMGANRTTVDLNAQLGGTANNLGDATIFNALTGDVTIDAGEFIMQRFEKLTVSGLTTPGGGPRGSANLTINAARMELGDLTVGGNLILNAGPTGEIRIVQRPAAGVREDDVSASPREDVGTDIVVAGNLNITAGLLAGDDPPAGIEPQLRMPIGAGNQFFLEVGTLGDRIIIGGQVTVGIFTLSEGQTFDYIASPANPDTPFAEQLDILEIELAEEELSEALREELLNLRIFARELTAEERREGLLAGRTIFNQLIVDEAAPISDHEVAVARISTRSATDAVARAREIFGEDGEGLARMGDALSAAYEEFSSRNPEGGAEAFADYLATATSGPAQAGREAADALVDLFDRISRIGVTETEVGISRRNVLSRLRVEGLRGRDLIDFFDAYEGRLQSRDLAGL